MKGIRLVVSAVTALALPAVAVAGASPAPQQFCQVRFTESGPLFDGVGIPPSRTEPSRPANAQ